MDTSTWSADTWVTLAAVIVAVLATVPAYVSLRFTRAAAEAARDQTELQRDIAREARLPQVWADVRPHPQSPSILCLFVGNSGPTAARDVRVAVVPAILPGRQPFRCTEAQEAAANGIAALPPGRVYEWILGVGHELLNAPGQVSEHEIRVEARAPGDTELTDSFTVRLDDLRLTRLGGTGTLKDVTRSIDKLREELEQIGRAPREPLGWS